MYFGVELQGTPLSAYWNTSSLPHTYTSLVTRPDAVCNSTTSLDCNIGLLNVPKPLLCFDQHEPALILSPSLLLFFQSCKSRVVLRLFPFLIPVIYLQADGVIPV